MQLKPSFFIAYSVTCLVFALCTASAHASVTPKPLIESYHVAIKSILESGKDRAEVRSQITSELGSIVDFSAFAELALKKYYPKLKKKEKALYIRAFKDLIEATYVKRIKPGGGHELIFRDEPEELKGKVLVPTTVAKGDSEVDLDYLFHRQSNGTWKIYDIWIDEVSMARNYRSQFYKIYREHGLRGKKGLLAHMQKRKTDETK